MTKLTTSMELTQKDIDEVVEMSNYNSMMTLVSIIKDLKSLQARLELGEKVKFENKVLTIDSYKKLVENNFSTYIYKSVFKDSIIKGKVYFDIINTEPGIDLSYTEDKENKLYSWIADINKEFCLMKLNPTGVIYIRNNKTNQYIDFISEKGNHYKFDSETGKIIEIM